MPCRKKPVRNEAPKAPKKKLPGSKRAQRLRNVLGLSCDALSDQVDDLIDEIGQSSRTPRVPKPVAVLSDEPEPAGHNDTPKGGYRRRAIPGPPPAFDVGGRKDVEDRKNKAFTSEEKDAIRTRLRDEDSVRKTPAAPATSQPSRVSPGDLVIGASYHLRDKDFVDGVYRFEQIIRSRTTIQFLFRNVISGAATTYTMHSIRDVAFFSPIEKRRS